VKLYWLVVPSERSDGGHVLTGDYAVTYENFHYKDIRFIKFVEYRTLCNSRINKTVYPEHQGSPKIGGTVKLPARSDLFDRSLPYFAAVDEDPTMSLLPFSFEEI
jgi:hypothetical protein